MPPLRPVSSLGKLCTSTIANHLLDVFSSWYTTQKVRKLTQDVDEYSNKLCHSDVYRLKGEFALDNCYSCDCCHGVRVHDDNHVTKNKWLIKLLTDGQIYDEGKPPNPVDDADKKGLAPVPIQHETETPTTVLLVNKMKDCLTCDIEFARPVMQDILSTVLDLIAQRVNIPRPTEKTRCYDEDLDFINSVGFYLRVSVTSLLSKTVNTLDFTSVSHLVNRWKVLCYEGVTLKNGREVDSPYFDIFGYALDITLPELRTLKYLKVPHCVHNNLVRKITFLCPNLETLILRCSPKSASIEGLVPVVTNLSVFCGLSTSGNCPDGTHIHLRGCRNLVALELPKHYEECDINYLVFELLSECPKLEWLIGAPMINVHQYIDLHHHCLIQPVKLTNFHHDRYRSSPFKKRSYSEGSYDDEIIAMDSNKDLSQLSKVFPQVKEVWLEASDKDIKKVLTNFPSSEKITLYQDCFSSQIPIYYLKNLTVLNMSDLSHKFCDLRYNFPNLQELTIRSMFLLELENDRQEMSTFRNIHTLKFHDVKRLEPDELMTILAVCPALLHFELVMVFRKYPWETPDEMFKELDVTTFQSALPYFEKLQKFVYKVNCFYSYETSDDKRHFPRELTMGSLRSMISCCPDLKYVGHLRTWNITLEEVNVLKEEAKTNNWDLEIVW